MGGGGVNGGRFTTRGLHARFPADPCRKGFRDPGRVRTEGGAVGIDTRMSSENGNCGGHKRGAIVVAIVGAV